MVSIVGRPNVGKSTLLNQIIGQKIAIVSKVPQTTRQQIRGIYNDERGQIVFIDTPGMHRGRDRLDAYMQESSSSALDDMDCLIYLVDTTRRTGDEELRIAQRLKDIKTPIVLGLNKVDVRSADIPSYISHWEQVKRQKVQEMENFTMVALSGLTGTNVDKLLDVVYEYLPEGPPLYPVDQKLDQPRRMTVAEVIREKLFNIMKDEVPHSLGVVIEDMRPVKGKTIYIRAVVIVERDTQKEMVVGRGGQTIKDVGTMAREELEQLLGQKVYLECFVKTEKGWRDKPALLQELGYEFY